MLRIAVLARALAGVGLCWVALTGRAEACGGLFCNQSQPVNQAAERILFVDNGNSSVTAVIEIQYEGPSTSFSWVLPVAGVPKVGFSSTTAFDRLQQRSDPQYMLQTTFEGECNNSLGSGSAKSAGFSAPRASSANHNGADVSVLAAGSVGPYDYQVIKVDPALKQPEDAALKWLKDNGYDVTALGPAVLHPYLADNLNLIAFRLKKDSMTGAIRPITITYDSDQPYIPIRPTAVAANDDMGVMVWVASKSRAIPDNYKALELNEARINWFSPMATYNAVVSAAADESGGQGFVTEMASPSAMLQGAIVQSYEMQQWQSVSNGQFSSAAEFINAASQFASWDGFAQAVDDGTTLPAGVSVQDFLNCMNCYQNAPGFTFDADAFRKSLYENVYKPMYDTEMLLQSRPYVTRLYTTMSADEMTVDPSFNFNADLADVSNIHMADQVMGCDGSWRVTLPQGDTVYGKDPGTWPDAVSKQPAARKISQLATKGKGVVMLDNSAKISKLLLASASTHEGQISLAPTDEKSGMGNLTGGGSGDCSAALANHAQPSVAALCGAAAFVLFLRRRRRTSR